MKFTDEQILNFLGLKEGDIIKCEKFEAYDNINFLIIEYDTVFEKVRMKEYNPGTKKTTFRSYSLSFLFDWEFEKVKKKDLKTIKLIKDLTISEAQNNPHLTHISPIIDLLAINIPQTKYSHTKTTLSKAYEIYKQKIILQPLTDIIEKELNQIYPPSPSSNEQ